MGICSQANEAVTGCKSSVNFEGAECDPLLGLSLWSALKKEP